MDANNRRIVSRSLKGSRHWLLAAWCCLIFAGFIQAQDLTFSVPGTTGRNWFDTQLDIAPGTLLRLSVDGEVNVGSGRGVHGPRGTTKFTDATGYPVETRYRYGLVARLTPARTTPDQILTNPGQSEDGLYEQWAYGDTPGNRYCSAQGGHLWLTVNDNNPGDNSGAFTVTLTRGTCPSSADETRIRVLLYTADNRSFRSSVHFRVGDPIMLKVENNTPVSIYLRQALDPSRLIREEGLQVERIEGSGYVRVLPSGRSGPEQIIKDNGNGTGTSTSIDYAVTQLMELRSTMNITRRWAALGPLAPGSYRLSLVYYDSRDTQRPPHTIYSPTFVVQ